jgi:predicted transcriptional regulator of viral defense system
MIVGNDRVARCSGLLKFLLGAVGLAGIVEMVTVREVAEIMRCSKAHVCKIINSQVAGPTRLAAVRLGRRKLVRRANHGNYHVVSPALGVRVGW